MKILVYAERENREVEREGTLIGHSPPTNIGKVPLGFFFPPRYE